MTNDYLKKTVGWITLFCALSLSFVSQAATITLGSKNFTEQHILSAITVQYLKSQGFDVSAKTDLSTVILRDAMLNKQIDMNWEYTGTSLIIFNHISDKMSAQQTYETVKKLDGEKGLIWLEPSDMNNTYAFAMKRSESEKYQIKTLSDLANKINDMQKNDAKNNWLIGFDVEFVNRPDGLRPMEKLYQFQLKRQQIRQMDPGLVYNAIRDGFLEAGLVFTTDGRIKGFDLQILDDDKGYFPSYALTPVVRKEVLQANPKLEEALNTLSRLFTNDSISALNAKVDIEHHSAESVAREFLQQHGLI
jgi:osmoprotectant transport system substrate-binding protein